MGLPHLLVDGLHLLPKTHNYHWNVTGPMFDLHWMFEDVRHQLVPAVDLIAERTGFWRQVRQLVQSSAGSPASRGRGERTKHLIHPHCRGRGRGPDVSNSFPWCEAHDELTADLLTQAMR